jgi:hypothetical protein
MLPANSVFDRQCPIEGGDRWNTATVPEVKVAAIVNWFGIGDVADLLEGPNARNYAREWFGSMSNAEQLANNFRRLITCAQVCLQSSRFMASLMTLRLTATRFDFMLRWTRQALPTGW